MTMSKTNGKPRECRGKRCEKRYLPLVNTMIEKEVPIKKAAKLLGLELKVANQLFQQAKAKEPELYRQAVQFDV